MFQKAQLEKLKIAYRMRLLMMCLLICLYLIRNLYPEHLNNPHNSTVKTLAVLIRQVSVALGLLSCSWAKMVTHRGAGGAVRALANLCPILHKPQFIPEAPLV